MNALREAPAAAEVDWPTGRRYTPLPQRMAHYDRMREALTSLADGGSEQLVRVLTHRHLKHAVKQDELARTLCKLARSGNVSRAMKLYHTVLNHNTVRYELFKASPWLAMVLASIMLGGAHWSGWLVSDAEVREAAGAAGYVEVEAGSAAPLNCGGRRFTARTTTGAPVEGVVCCDVAGWSCELRF